MGDDVIKKIADDIKAADEASALKEQLALHHIEILRAAIPGFWASMVSGLMEGVATFNADLVPNAVSEWKVTVTPNHGSFIVTKAQFPFVQGFIGYKPSAFLVELTGTHAPKTQLEGPRPIPAKTLKFDIDDNRNVFLVDGSTIISKPEQFANCVITQFFTFS